MATKPWTPDDDTRLRELHTAETPVRKMAADLDRTRSAVARRLTHLGLTSTRTQTVAATAANMADAKARRAALQLNLLEDAERLRAQLWQPHTYFDWGGKDHDYDEKVMPEPTPADKLKLMQAAGAAVDRIIKIDTHDAGHGVPEAVSMLDRLATALGLPDTRPSP